MAVDNRQQSQLNGLGYDTVRYPQPHFRNPWVSAPGAPSGQLYSTSLPNGLDNSSAQQGGRPTSVSMSYGNLPVTQSSLGADLMKAPNSYGVAFTASGSPNISSFAPTSAPQYAMDFNQSRNPNPYYQQDNARRSSHPMNTIQAQRNSFSEALDASRGMLAMSQDITPRNIYGNQGSSRSSTDSYGFPSTHSSVSSASTYPNFYNGSSSVAEGSVTDYSSASESVEPMTSRTLPRPNAMVGTVAPPAPQSMMGQFSSKISSSSQKKHKCKICDKRFTRPSSLQTHMYSHTGEKPFACEVEGCGRHFSVVSNLRRHRKVHKNERDHPSPDDM